MIVAMNDTATWIKALTFLFDATIRKINMHPMQMTIDPPEIEAHQETRFRKTRIVVTFWVEPR